MLASMHSHNVRGALPVGPAPSANMFSRRTSCRWIQQTDELSARFCNDGTVTMWRDIYHNVWLPTEKPPKIWQKAMKFYRKNPTAIQFGAASTAGVGALQSALEALSRRVDDHQVATTMDGRMGPRTAEATNRALKVYANTAPLTLRTGALPQAVILTQLVPIIGYINAAKGIAAKVSSAIYYPPKVAQTLASQLQPASQVRPAAYPQSMYMPRGASTMPAPGYYPPPGYGPPGYAPQPGYYPQRGPGGLPANQASLDIKAFIPAQYEHVRIHPSLPMIVLGGIVVFFLMKNRETKHRKE